MKHIHIVLFALFGLLIIIPATNAQRDGELPIAPNPTAMPTETEPTIDTDMDTVPDSEDLCPQSAGYPEWNGCPDTDGDGLTTQYDNCPNEFGSRENLGCPDAVTPIASPQVVALPVLPEDACYVATQTSTPVNIRQGTSTSTVRIATLDPNQPQRAISISDGWIQLENGGYVSQAVVRLSNSCDETLADNNTADDVNDLEVVTDGGGDDEYKCIYFTGLFRNTGDEEEILLIELPDALGQGSFNHIGPALVPVGETYFAEKHFLVPESWVVPNHPEAGWNMFYDEVGTDVFDFSQIGEVNFLVTLLEDCSSPHPICYYAPLTINNPNDTAINTDFLLTLVSGNDAMNAEWTLTLPNGDLSQSYVVASGETTHNLYVLSYWHYDESEHLNLTLMPNIRYTLTDTTLSQLNVLLRPEVEVVPIESINHLCDLNPVQVSSVVGSGENDFAPPPDTNVCYYFEQGYLNLTDLPITSPEYQLVVNHREGGSEPYDVFSDTFSTTVFSNGDKLQHLQFAPNYDLEFDSNSDLFISYRQLTPLSDGLIEAGPTLFMIVDDSYCENGSMPFTHDELFETIDHACYRIHLNYVNNTEEDVVIMARLRHYRPDGFHGSIGEYVTRTWEPFESRSYVFSFVIDEIPADGYVSYSMTGAVSLDDLATFSVIYNCPLAQ